MQMRMYPECLQSIRDRLILDHTLASRTPTGILIAARSVAWTRTRPRASRGYSSVSRVVRIMTPHAHSEKETPALTDTLAKRGYMNSPMA